MGAYAMAHTAAPEREDLSALTTAFADLIADLDAKERHRLEASREKIDQLYWATREQINQLMQEEHKGGKA